MGDHMKSIWIGYDQHEDKAFTATCRSIKRHLSSPIKYEGLFLHDLKERGLYRRPTEFRSNGAGKRQQIWDVISDAPCATEFSISRFLVPHLASSGWALFMDCDMLARADLNELFDLANPKYAVMCVKHNYSPLHNVKMDGQIQTLYARKNWSSVMLFNVDHPSNKKLTVDLVNTVPGRDLHRFCWLDDDEIGRLGQEWNWLAGHSDPSIDPKIVHYTEGTPNLPGYENAPYADEWRAVLRKDWRRIPK